MILLLVLTTFGFVLSVLLWGSLRYLNLSQLREKFSVAEYDVILKQLANRDAVELAAEFLSVMFGMAAGWLCLEYFSMVSGFPFLMMVIFVSVVKTIFPRLLVAPWAERLLVEMLPLYTLLETFPFVVRLMNGLQSLERKFAGESAEEEHALEMEHLLSEGEAEGAVDRVERLWMEGVIDLKDTVAREVMTPWVEAVYLQHDDTVRKGIALSAEHGISRLPIYDSNRDQVLGVFFVRDILDDLVESTDVLDELAEKHMRQVPMISETRSISRLLITMSQSRNQLVLIVDEYGSLNGLLTMEDILEEIVGDIRDEYGFEDREIVPYSETQADVVASTRLEDINESLNLDFPENERYESLAGFILAELQRIPRRGESFRINGYQFQILQATARRIERVRLNWKKDDSAAEIEN